MAFPEKIICEVQNVNEVMEKRKEENVGEVNRVASGKDEKYCHLHGKGTHWTTECEIVKLVESRGWVRKRKETRSGNNKRNYNYFAVNTFKNFFTNNPFRIRGYIGSTATETLLDSGADISIISESFAR